MQIDTAYIRTLTDMGDFLKYLVSLYGKELYKDKQHLCNLIADLYKGEERQKKLFRRAILEDNMARRVYDISQKALSERKALADAIAYRFAENNYLTNEIGEKVTSAFIKGIKLLGEISWKLLKNGNWEDNQGCVYNNDKTILLEGNRHLKEIIVVDGTIEIGNGALFDCSSLVEISIPNSVTNIGAEAFKCCDSLTEITIPNSVTKIGSRAFSDCRSLKNIKIPNSITEIGSGTFSNCKSLKNIKIPNSVTKIGSGAFINCILLEDINITNSVVEIGGGAFINCRLLKNINIPNSVTKIKDWTFRVCVSLIAITIPDNLTNIGKFAFGDCISLKTIIIPDSVTTIEHFAFKGCTALKTIIASRETFNKFRRRFPSNVQWQELNP